MKKLTITIVIGVSLYVFATAPRKVSIPAVLNSSSTTSEGISLYNGSSSNVNYKITCYNKNGNTNFGPTEHSLSAKTFVKHGDNPKCNSGNLATSGSFSNGMVTCDYTNVPSPSSCPASFHLCSFSEMQTNANNDGSMGWVDANTFTFTVSGTWSVGISSNSSTSYSDYSKNPSGYGPMPKANSNSTCYTSTQGSGSAQAYCGATYLNSNMEPWGGYNFCCPGTGSEISSAACDVEILSTTPSEGYLQSPQFKSNAPF